jgi:hypothetical protein
MPAGRLTRRERRVIEIGAAIAIAAIVFRFGVVPFSERWSARDQRITSGAETLARMRGLVAEDAKLRSALASRENAGDSRRLVSGRTAALAGSALQTALQGYADRSRITINRLDVAGSPDSAGASALPSIPVTISAVGDVYGLSEFLSLLQYGTPVVQVKQLTVVSNSSLRGGLLQMSFQLVAPAVIE